MYHEYIAVVAILLDHIEYMSIREDGMNYIHDNRAQKHVCHKSSMQTYVPR
jgi:hypothetical protein